MAPGSPYTDAEIRAQIDPTPIGGGSGYLSTLNAGQIWTESDADVTVSSTSEFQNACRYSPSSGETYVVWVADGAVINMTGEDTLLTGGSGKKVIAGNRGQGGANGPLVYSNTRGLNSVAYNGGSVTGTIQVQGTVEVFGVRFRGWAYDNWDSDEYPGYIPLKDSSEYYAEVQRCFSLRTDNAEIHNCEIFGWATQGMYVGTRGTPSDPHIHHNDIHDCMQTAFGYGIDCGNGRPLIEYNYINACRHGVNGSGYSTSGWRCYNNVFGPSYSQHPIDMHSQSNNGTGSSSNYNSRGYHGNAGGRMVFRNNTVTCTRHISDANVQGGHRTPAIGIRGVPWPRSGSGIIIEDNRFEHDDVKDSRPSPGHQYSGKENYSLAVHQQWTRHNFNFSSRLGVDDYTPNFVFNNNQTNGSTAPYDPSVGAPVNLNGSTQVNRDLTVAVRSEDNNERIEGADVTLTDSADDTWIRTTNAQGNANFDSLPTGGYDIDIAVSGWRNFSGSLTHNADTTHTFRLERLLDTVDVRIGTFEADGTAIEGATVTVPGAVDPAGETRTTNVAGYARYELWDDEWDIELEASGYYSESRAITVDTSQGDRDYDYTLTPDTEDLADIRIQATDDAGDGIEGATVEIPDSSFGERQTNSAGRARFNLGNGEYTVHITADGYASLTDTITVDTSEGDRIIPFTLAPDISGGGGGDEDEDDGPTLPDGETFYEVCALETAADDQWNLPVLVCNVGGNSGEVTIELARGTADDLGNAIDRRHVDLDPGEARILRLSVRMAYLEQSGSIEMVVHSPHDSEEFSVTAAGTVEPVIGPGRPGTLGGEFSGTLGGDNPRTLGRMRAHVGVTDPDIARVPGDWAITLENPAGERRHFNSVREVSPSVEHTKLSTWSAVVPADPSVPDWSDSTRAWITLDETIQWVGYCENATLSTDGQTTHLEGRGPGADLDDGSFEFPTGGISEYRAIENAVERLASEWDWYVVRPDNPTVIPDDQTLTGSRIDIIKQLHDDWGYRFLIDNREFKRAISFPPQGATSKRAFTTLDWERSEGSERQYNRVQIRGDWRRNEDGNPIGGRYIGTAINETAIQRRADEYGITEEAATETYHRTDSSIESDEMAHARADAKLRELRENNEYGGSLNTLAQRVNAGLAYPMPWDTDVKTGAWAAQFDQGAGVSGIGQAFRESRQTGALTMWVNATWSDRSDREIRMVAGINDVTETNADGRALGITTTDPEGLGLQIDSSGGSTAITRAYPGDELPPDDEWIFLHYDWAFDADAGTTAIRAGRNGTITDTGTVSGQVLQPRDVGWLGRFDRDHYVGLLDMVSVWDSPLSTDEYARLTAGGDIASDSLVARYPLEEGPHETTGAIHDVIGGVHGESENLLWGGTPQTLESVSYNMEAKTMDLAFEQIAGYADHERLEHLEAEIERLKRQQQ